MGIAVRMKSQRLSSRVLLPAAMAVVGGIIVIASLPSWLLLTFVGAGLVAGAYVLYQNSQ